ncbi:MAG: carboxypeptidase-like regulatory domain-containing protein [Polyangiaceae bacterium]
MNRVKRTLAGACLALLTTGQALAATPAGSANNAAPQAASGAAAPAKSAAPSTANNGHVAPVTSGAENRAAAPPPAHPSMGSAGNDQQADVNESVAGLEPGSITATIVDDRGVPIAGQQVRLGILFQKIAEGEARSEKFANADAEGTVHFTGLTRGSDNTYRVTVQAGSASYQTAPFNLRQDMGQRVILHVYPSTSQIEQAQIGMRGYLYVETRDDVFQCEAMFRVFNVGQITWVPKDVVMQLPKGFKAFKAPEGMTDVRFEQVDGVGARLKGTFSPGQNEASFRFQLPKGTDDTLTFRMTLPPHVAEMRVIAEASSTMNLEVEGFQPPVPAANNNGQRVLVSVKQLLRHDEELKEFVATLSGIPTPGPGRWFAIAIALCLCIGGVFAANGAFDDASGGKDLAADKKRARELLLRELVALEAARRAERIGPRSYEQSRSALIDAIARLGLPATGQRRRSKDSKAGAARNRIKSAAERG